MYPILQYIPIVDCIPHCEECQIQFSYNVLISDCQRYEVMRMLKLCYQYHWNMAVVLHV